MRENKLQVSFEDIVAHLPTHVYWLDRNNVFLGCNDLHAEFAGLKNRHEIAGKTNFDMPWRDQADAINRTNNEVMRIGQPLSIEEIAMQADGTELVFLSNKIPLRDSHANIVGTLGISFDITKQKETERKLIETKEKTDIALDNIIAHLPGHVYWLDRNNILLGCNDSQAVSAGLKNRHEIVGKTNFDMPWRDQADMLNRVNNEVMHTGQGHSVEEVTKKADGTELIFLSKKVPLRDSHAKIVGTLGISFDITKQKATEKQLIETKEMAEAANHAKTEFIENMRHDIRGPLSSIVGLSEILGNSELDHEKIRVYTGHLRNSSEALLSFLNKILESINVATGEIPLLKNRFILYEVLESVINLHRAIAAEKNLEMNFYFDESIPKYLIGDPLRIYRIVLELLVNALKFTHQGHVNIYAQLNRKDKDTRLHVIKIIIEDTGIGIAKDKQQELFVRFKRLTPSYQGIYKGTGLGLSIAKQFLDDLQAEIYLESALNEGTRFTCVFQLREALLNETLDASFDESHAVLKHSAVVALTTPPELPVQSALRVLVVEDNSIAAIVAQTILEDVGCSVDLAIDGMSAVVLSRNKDYHLIFMDIGLPDFDGYEATSQIRAIETQKATIAGGSHRAFIVGLTAHAEPDKKQRGLDVGMNVVLTKPLSRDKAITLFEMSVGRSAIVS